MKLWQRQYMVIWLLMFEFLLTAHLFNTIVITALHVLLAVGVLLLTTSNSRMLAAEPVPARLKRISKTTANLAVAQVVVGLLVGIFKYAPLGLAGRILATIATVIHIMVALAMITQAASVATAYDMRDEQELIDGPNKDAPPPGAKKDAAAS